MTGLRLSVRAACMHDQRAVHADIEPSRFTVRTERQLIVEPDAPRIGTERHTHVSCRIRHQTVILTPVLSVHFRLLRCEAEERDFFITLCYKLGSAGDIADSFRVKPHILTPRISRRDRRGAFRALTFSSRRSTPSSCCCP